MEPIHTIVIDEISIDSGQYLPRSFGKCHHLHGHTYIIRNLVIQTKGIVDFNLLKTVYAQFDHILIAPECDKPEIEKIIAYMVVERIDIFEIVPLYIPYEYGAVEYIGEYLKTKLLEIKGVIRVSFKLYETPKSGMVVQ